MTDQQSIGCMVPNFVTGKTSTVGTNWC